MVRYRTVGPNVDYLAREGGEQREISALIRERDHGGRKYCDRILARNLQQHYGSLVLRLFENTK